MSASVTPRPVTPECLLLSRRDVAELLPMAACIAAVERAFLLHSRGLSDAPGVLGTHVVQGGFHVKTAGLADPEGRHLYAAKVNANFPDNRRRSGLPTIQGIIVLFDADKGKPLGVLDSIEITSRRTAAATAVAAKYLARPESSIVTIAGCGEQSRYQLRALAEVRRIRRVLAYDVVATHAEEFAAAISTELSIEADPVPTLAPAAHQSDIIVTCTPSTTPILFVGDVSPGAFVAGVGADASHKHELDPALLSQSTLVVDILEQCATIGDLHHALEAGVMQRSGVHAELAEVVSGKRPGRSRAEEVIVFDSTGTALQDVAAATVVYQRAVEAGRGIPVTFGG